MMTQRQKRGTMVALALLAPNFIGFVIFTAGPVLFSMIMAFTNWNLTIHNDMSNIPVRFIGFDNFKALFFGHEWRYFSKYLGNTVYMMLAIPIGIALSLCGALLLNGELKPASGKKGIKSVVIAAIITILITVMLALMKVSAIVLFLCALTGVLVILGQIFGQTSFRTFYYLPNLTSGVAIFILWKALYRPETGPINTTMRPMLAMLSKTVESTPATLWLILGIIIILAAIALFIYTGIAMTHRVIDRSSSILGAILTMIGITGIALGISAIGQVVINLPDAVKTAGVLMPPEWLTSVVWSKPAIMLMGIFMAMGSNNMLLYLAALSNVPASLTEAAAIDGANKWQTFWNVTWPQLAPTTFFIVIMSTIGGLQGGFEQARVMTSGGPAGSTTTLSYFLYLRGFEDYQLGLASAIAWTMFVMIFILTIINWRFGNTMVND